MYCSYRAWSSDQCDISRISSYYIYPMYQQHFNREIKSPSRVLIQRCMSVILGVFITPINVMPPSSLVGERSFIFTHCNYASICAL